MDFDYLGSVDDGPTLELDHEQFAYAGNFRLPKTGKTVVRDDGSVIGAVAFNADRARENAVRLRYVTVREDRRGEGIGPQLLRFTGTRLRDRYDDVLIAVNNPIAYQACYRAGFGWTGEESGMAELLLRYDPEHERSADRYRDGLAVFQDRDLPQAQQAILDRYLDSEPPAIVPVPSTQSP